MSLVVMGISYKTATIEQRGPAAVPEEQLPAALGRLCDDGSVKGAVLLSTCNRVEAYLDAKTDRLGEDALRSFFASWMGAAFDADLFYVLRGPEVVRHAYRVVCSLDSQLLGEAQILGQMRRAYEAALDAGTTSETLAKLFTSAFTLGKRVRTETAIGADSVSLSTTAYQVACENVPDITRAHVLLIGSGEMAELEAKYLLEGGVAGLSVCSRTRAHAQAFSRETGAAVVPFEHRYTAIAHSDVVFSMTGAEEPVVRADELRRARAAAPGERACAGAAGEPLADTGRATAAAPAASGAVKPGAPDSAAAVRPLVLIDEAVPRDVETACGALPGVRVFDLDHLTSIVDAGMARRMEAVGTAERLVAQAEQEFLAWMQERLVTPTIKTIHEKGSLIVQHEFDHAVRVLERERGAALSDKERDTLAAYGNAIMKKILHGPTVRLRKEAQTADSYYYTGAARYLFGIETYPPGTHHRACGHGEGCGHGCTTTGVCDAPSGHPAETGSIPGGNDAPSRMSADGSGAGDGSASCKQRRANAEAADWRPADGNAAGERKTADGKGGGR